jgi:hypothetical protein
VVEKSRVSSACKYPIFVMVKGGMRQPDSSATEWNLIGWFWVIDAGLLVVSGKMLTRLFHLTAHHAITVDTGHGFFALDAGGEWQFFMVGVNISGGADIVMT